MKLWILTFTVLVGCGGDLIVPRTHFNDGLAALSKGDLETADSELREARNQAGSDLELKYRAALALAHTSVRKADEIEVAEPDKALVHLRDASGWFQDAARLRPKSDVPRQDLERVLKRIQILADKLNKDGGIEGRLDTLLTDQRQVQVEVRELLTVLDGQGVTDPVSFRSEFGAVATRERSLVADLGTLIDLAGDERDLISQKPEKEREDKERVRLIQLESALRYLDQARKTMGDTRRELRKLSAKGALKDAAEAVNELKRAREQLLDPIAVLRAIAAEEIQLATQTAQLQQLSAVPELDAQPAGKAPAWLNPERLAARQELVVGRTIELGLRLGAADPTQVPADADPKQKRLVESAKAAAPLVATAEGHMKTAIARLQSGDLKAAAELEGKAAEALLEAVELFADVRTLIELTYKGHSEATLLLTPAEAGNPISKIGTDERATMVSERTAKSAVRLGRLDALLQEELAAVEAAAAQAQAQGGQAAEGTDGDKQRIERAKELRGQAEEAITRLSKALNERSPEALAIAKEALGYIEELRRLYFSVIEHLKELHAAQNETRDKTAEADALEDDKKGPAAAELEVRERSHLATGEAIAKALEAQADAASQSQDPKAADQADRLGRASVEVRKALVAAENAAAKLAVAKEEASAASVSLQPAVADEQTATDHLAEAIRILEPPKQQDQKDQQQDQEQDQDDKKDEQKQQQQQQPSPDKLSKQEAQRRLQAIREREAERRKKKPKPTTDSVEKDW